MTIEILLGAFILYVMTMGTVTLFRTTQKKKRRWFLR